MPDPSPDADRKPDAILFNVGWEPPGPWTGDGRVYRLCRHFEPILGASPAQKAHIRDVGAGQFLVSLSPADTLLYPDDHRLSKWPRYDWTTMPDGLKHGFLKPETPPA
jgi:hypothetical protein